MGYYITLYNINKFVCLVNSNFENFTGCITFKNRFLRINFKDFAGRKDYLVWIVIFRQNFP